MALPRNPSELDITVVQGALFSQPFKVTSGTTPVNITGYTFSGEVRNNLEDDTLVTTLSMSITSAANGEFKAELSAATTASLETSVNPDKRRVNLGNYDIFCTDSSGNKKMIFYGRVWLIRKVTA